VTAPAPRRLLLATGNAHKVTEVAAILGPGWAVEAADPDVEETGDTFEANALLKARALRDRTGELAVADDSGIEVDALDGAPGIHSARWTEEGDWIPRVLRELERRPGAARTCRYVCAAAVARPDGTEDVVRGTVEGLVVDAPRGTGGFGYDPVVAPVEGDGRTFGEMSEDEKHAISHRARAFRELVPRLDTLP
jgi:XTP/dITP diphosphohydrolase